MKKWLLNEALDLAISYIKQPSTLRGFFMSGCAALHLTLSQSAENQFLAWALAGVGLVEIIRNEERNKS